MDSRLPDMGANHLLSLEIEKQYHVQSKCWSKKDEAKGCEVWCCSWATPF